MPIPIRCPHCEKLWRLKDEFAGKTVKCPNAECRKPFPVPVPKAAADAETEALTALREEPDQPAEQKVIAVKCEMCDHKWDVPWSMQGKNVLCPECRHRNKVPMQKVAKAADWKSGGGKPSLARVEQLEGVSASTEASRVSYESMKDAGAIEIVYEPRPASFYLLYVGLPLLLVAGLGFGVMSYSKGRSNAKETNLMDEARKSLDEAVALMPPLEQPLARGAFALAVGEYLGRQNDAAKLKEAVTQFTRARQELDGAGASVGRTILLGELAVAQLNLGGTDDQATAGTHLRWKPGGRLKLNEKQATVQGELADTLAALRRDDKLVPLAERHLVARKVARQAAELGQPAVLDEVLPRLFTDAEAADGQAIAALEQLKVAGDAEAGKKRATELVPLAAGGSGPYLQALVVAVGPIPGLNMPNPPAAGQVPSDGVRQTHTAALLVGKKWDEALELAGRGKTPESRGSRALALALAGEWADDPKPAVTAAAGIVETEAKPKDVGIPDGTLVRLAAAAGRAGLADKAEVFVKAIDKPDARAWAVAEANRSKADAEAKPPEDAKDYRGGVAWQLLWAARQAARATGSRDAVMGYDRWGPFKPFGYAGLALGLQDGKK